MIDRITLALLIFIIGCLLLFISYGRAAADSMSVGAGASYAVLDSEDNFTGLTIGYNHMFAEKWSISGEFENLSRINNGGGGIRTITGVLRYYPVYGNRWRVYGMLGGGLAYPDFERRNGSEGDQIFNIVGGAGTEFKINNFGVSFEGRYLHRSNSGTGVNYGDDELGYRILSNYYFGW